MQHHLDAMNVTALVPAQSVMPVDLAIGIRRQHTLPSL
jgi:hypothetical protein